MTDRVRIFDTTLRDGEQSPGIALTADEKVAIAGQLARLGVDIVEAGFPASSPGDFAAVQRIAREVEGPVIAGLARANEGDVKATWDAVCDAERSRIHVFIATSPIHMERKLRMTHDEVLSAIRANVARAVDVCDDVEFSAEDATRSDVEFLIEAFNVAVEAGATTINVPDTVGYATPNDFGALIARVVAEVKGDRPDVVISTHCHNDLGLAVANSLAGVQAGARQVEGAINGIGERAGNSSIEEMVMALRIRQDEYEVEIGVDTTELYATSQMVSELTKYPIQYNKAVVGRNSFAHESGIHQHGVLRDRETYEIMDPTAGGQTGTHIVIGKHSGRAAVRDRLEHLEIELDDEAFAELFERLKEKADRKIEITDDVIALVAEDVRQVEELVRFVSLEVGRGPSEVPHATVKVAARELTLEYEAEGDGMIDAAFQAVSDALDRKAELVHYEVRPLTDGSDASAEIEVTIRVDGHNFPGRATAKDVVVGSARAFVSAFNRAEAHRGEVDG